MQMANEKYDLFCISNKSVDGREKKSKVASEIKRGNVNCEEMLLYWYTLQWTFNVHLLNN